MMLILKVKNDKNFDAKLTKLQESRQFASNCLPSAQTLRDVTSVAISCGGRIRALVVPLSMEQKCINVTIRHAVPGDAFYEDGYKYTWQFREANVIRLNRAYDIREILNRENKGKSVQWTVLEDDLARVKKLLTDELDHRMARGQDCIEKGEGYYDIWALVHEEFPRLYPEDFHFHFHFNILA